MEWWRILLFGAGSVMLGSMLIDAARTRRIRVHGRLYDRVHGPVFFWIAVLSVSLFFAAATAFFGIGIADLLK